MTFQALKSRTSMNPAATTLYIFFSFQFHYLPSVLTVSHRSPVTSVYLLKQILTWLDRRACEKKAKMVKDYLRQTSVAQIGKMECEEPFEEEMETSRLLIINTL